MLSAARAARKWRGKISRHCDPRTGATTGLATHIQYTFGSDPLENGPGRRSIRVAGARCRWGRWPGSRDVRRRMVCAASHDRNIGVSAGPAMWMTSARRKSSARALQNAGPTNDAERKRCVIEFAGGSLCGDGDFQLWRMHCVSASCANPRARRRRSFRHRRRWERISGSRSTTSRVFFRGDGRYLGRLRATSNGGFDRFDERVGAGLRCPGRDSLRGRSRMDCRCAGSASADFE